MVDRKPAEGAVKRGSESGHLCTICLDGLAESSASRLPCGHSYHKDCVEGLRRFGVTQACPSCRAELPQGAEKQREESTRRYFVIERQLS